MTSADQGGLAWKSPRKLIGDDMEGGDKLASSKMRRLSKKQKLIEVDATNSNKLARVHGFSPHRAILEYIADNVDGRVNDDETFFGDEIEDETIGGGTGCDEITDNTPQTIGLHTDVDLYKSFVKIHILNITEYKEGYIIELQQDQSEFEVDPGEVDHPGGEIIALYAKFTKIPTRFEDSGVIKTPPTTSFETYPDVVARRRNLLQIENNSSNLIDVIGSAAEDQIKPLLNVPRNEAEVMNYVGVIIAVLSSLATIIGLCLHRKMTFVTVNHHHQNEVKPTSKEETQPLKMAYLKVDAFL